MSTLGVAGNVAGLLSLTIQILGSIKPVFRLVESLSESSNSKSKLLDQVKGFDSLLQSSLQCWRQEPPVDTGATIQTLEECHREILRIQRTSERRRGRLKEFRQILRDFLPIRQAINRCLEGLQLNLALEHRYVA